MLISANAVSEGFAAAGQFRESATTRPLAAGPEDGAALVMIPNPARAYPDFMPSATGQQNGTAQAQSLQGFGS